MHMIISVLTRIVTAQYIIQKENVVSATGQVFSHRQMAEPHL